MKMKTFLSRTLIALFFTASLFAQETEESQKKLASMLLVTDYMMEYDGAWFLIQTEPEQLVVRIFHGIDDKSTCTEDMFYFTDWSYLTLTQGAINQCTLKGSGEMYYNDATYAGGEYEYNGESSAWLNLIEDNTTIYIYFACRGAVYEGRIDKDRENPTYATGLQVSDQYEDGWQNADYSFWYYLDLMGLSMTAKE